MSLGWPWMLVGLAAVPLLVLWYRRMLRVRAARRAELAALGLVAPEATARGWRRHVAPALVLASLVLLLTALARPEATVPQPRREGTVILAVDVSSSMAAADIAPTRLEAAKVTARDFVQRQPPTVRIGVVAFSGSALVVQEPTADRPSVIAAIDRLTPQGGTALGRGLQTSLSAIVGKAVLVDEPNNAVEPQGPDLGYHGSAAVVLLSDGENTVDPDPVDVAALYGEFLERRAAALILSTTNGTRTILAAASRCEEVLLGSLLNLGAVARAAVERGEDVAVLCAGFQGAFALDDAYCAGRIVQLLGGGRSDAAIAAELVAASFPTALEALNARTYGPPGLEEDIAFCAREDVLDVVPRLAGMVRTAAEIRAD
jgi:Mg-chelatase subunit ChlD